MKESVKIKNEIMNQKIKKEFPIKKKSSEKTKSAKRKKSVERKKSNAIKDLITKESDNDNSDYSSDNSDYSNDYLNYYSNDNICYITEWRSKYKKTCEHCSSEGCQECIYRFKIKIPISIPPKYIRERRPCLVCGTIPDDRNIWCNNCHNWL